MNYGCLAFQFTMIYTELIKRSSYFSTAGPVSRSFLCLDTGCAGADADEDEGAEEGADDVGGAALALAFFWNMRKPRGGGPALYAAGVFLQLRFFAGGNCRPL